MLFLSVNLNSATHTVTNGNDAGAGSLREIVANANSGDTIIFADTVNYITLTSGVIRITKELTIDGGNDTIRKITIDANNKSRIFYISDVNIPPNVHITVTINNLAFTRGYANSAGDNWDGGAIYSWGVLTTINCNFIQNFADVAPGGAVYALGSDFIAINCNFIQNYNKTNVGGAIYANCRGDGLILINCNFYENSSGLF